MLTRLEAGVRSSEARVIGGSELPVVGLITKLVNPQKEQSWSCSPVPRNTSIWGGDKKEFLEI